MLDNDNSDVQDLPEGQSLNDQFTYMIQDADGDTSMATLTITINGSNHVPELTVVGDTGTVYEAGLTPDGTGAGDTTTTVAGTFTLSDTDGLADIESISINGQSIAISSLGNNNLVSGDYGTLTVTDYNSSTGVATYTYTLTNPAFDGDGTEVEIFTLKAYDGQAYSDPASISIEVVDDVPIANNISGQVLEAIASSTNLMIILDLSGSMDNNPGVTGYATRLAVAKDAIDKLITEYDNIGDVCGQNRYFQFYRLKGRFQLDDGSRSQKLDKCTFKRCRQWGHQLRRGTTDGHKRL